MFHLDIWLPLGRLSFDKLDVLVGVGLRCLDPCSAFGAQVEQSSNHSIDPLSMSFEQVQQKESLRTTPLMNAPLEKVLGLLITVMTPNSRSTRHQLIRFQGCQLVAIHHRLTST